MTHLSGGGLVDVISGAIFVKKCGNGLRINASPESSIKGIPSKSAAIGLNFGDDGTNFISLPGIIIYSSFYVKVDLLLYLLLNIQLTILDDRSPNNDHHGRQYYMQKSLMGSTYQKAFKSVQDDL